jgi:hypothetical protein
MREKGVETIQVVTLRLKLHKPTLAKQQLYRELITRTTGLANNLVTAGRPTGLSSKTAAPYLPAPIPSAVLNQALRDMGGARRADRFRVLPPSFNNQTLVLKKVGGYWTASFPTHAGRVRVPLAVTDRQGQYLEGLEILLSKARRNCTKDAVVGTLHYLSPFR